MSEDYGISNDGGFHLVHMVQAQRGLSPREIEIFLATGKKPDLSQPPPEELERIDGDTQVMPLEDAAAWLSGGALTASSFFDFDPSHSVSPLYEVVRPKVEALRFNFDPRQPRDDDGRWSDVADFGRRLKDAAEGRKALKLLNSTSALGTPHQREVARKWQTDWAYSDRIRKFARTPHRVASADNAQAKMDLWNLRELTHESRASKDIRVSRGMVRPERVFGDAWNRNGDNTGLEWVDKAPLSTSANSKIAKKVTDEHEKAFGDSGEKIVMHILVPEGTGAVHLDDANVKVEEVLLMPGLRYRILHDSGPGKYRTLEVTVVPQDKSLIAATAPVESEVDDDNDNVVVDVADADIRRLIETGPKVDVLPGTNDDDNIAAATLAFDFDPHQPRDDDGQWTDGPSVVKKPKKAAKIYPGDNIEGIGVIVDVITELSGGKPVKTTVKNEAGESHSLDANAKVTVLISEKTAAPSAKLSKTDEAFDDDNLNKPLPNAAMPTGWRTGRGVIAHNDAMQMRTDALGGDWDSDQRRALNEYTEESADINNALRADSDTVFDGDDITEYTDALDSAMYPAGKSFTTYRQTTLDTLGVTSVDDVMTLIGTDHTDAAYQSTTISPRLNFQDMPVYMRIDVPKGTRGAYVADLSDFVHQREYILARNTKMTIVAAEVKNGRAFLRMKVVAQSDSVVASAAFSFDPHQPRDGDGKWSDGGANWRDALNMERSTWEKLSPSDQVRLRDAVDEAAKENLPWSSGAKHKIDVYIERDASGVPRKQIPEHLRPGASTPAPKSAALESKDALDSVPIKLSQPAGRDSKITESLDRYASIEYTAINAELRASMTSNPHVKMIDEAMRTSRLPSDIVVYRGMSGRGTFGKAWLRPDMAGVTYRDPAYVSTTTDKNIANSFTGEEDDDDFFNDGDDEDFSAVDNHVVARIVVPAGTGAVQISGEQAESEILLDRNMRFRIVQDHGTVAGVRQLDVEVIR